MHPEWDICIKGRNGLQKANVWFQECSLPAALCDKHPTLKELERLVELLITSLSNIPRLLGDVLAGKTGSAQSFAFFIIHFHPFPHLANIVNWGLVLLEEGGSGAWKGGLT